MNTTTVGYGVRVPRTRATRGVLYLRGLPKSLKLLFRSIVVRRGDTMERIVEELIRKYTEDPECVERWRRKRDRKAKKESKK